MAFSKVGGHKNFLVVAVAARLQSFQPIRSSQLPPTSSNRPTRHPFQQFEILTVDPSIIGQTRSRRSVLFNRLLPDKITYIWSPKPSSHTFKKKSSFFFLVYRLCWESIVVLGRIRRPIDVLNGLVVSESSFCWFVEVFFFFFLFKMAEERYNLKNPAVKRILQEVKEMQSNPSEDFMSLPLEVFFTRMPNFFFFFC